MKPVPDFPTHDMQYYAELLDSIDLLDPDLESACWNNLYIAREALCGHNPRCVVAGLVRLESERLGRRIPQLELSRSFHVCEVSIRNNRNKLRVALYSSPEVSEEGLPLTRAAREEAKEGSI